MDIVANREKYPEELPVVTEQVVRDNDRNHKVSSENKIHQHYFEGETTSIVFSDLWVSQAMSTDQRHPRSNRYLHFGSNIPTGSETPDSLCAVTETAHVGDAQNQMLNTEFVLIPSYTDNTWTNRFIEAALCRCIPIIGSELPTETDVIEGFFFLRSNDPEIHNIAYQDPETQHRIKCNFDLAFRRHTLLGKKSISKKKLLITKPCGLHWVISVCVRHVPLLFSAQNEYNVEYVWDCGVEHDMIRERKNTCGKKIASCLLKRIAEEQASGTSVTVWFHRGTGSAEVSCHSVWETLRSNVRTILWIDDLHWKNYLVPANNDQFFSDYVCPYALVYEMLSASVSGRWTKEILTTKLQTFPYFVHTSRICPQETFEQWIHNRVTTSTHDNPVTVLGHLHLTVYPLRQQMLKQPNVGYFTTDNWAKGTAIRNTVWDQKVRTLFACVVTSDTIGHYFLGKYLEIPAMGALMLAEPHHQLADAGFFENVHYLDLSETTIQQVANTFHKFREDPNDAEARLTMRAYWRMCESAKTVIRNLHTENKRSVDLVRILNPRLPVLSSQHTGQDSPGISTEDSAWTHGQENFKSPAKMPDSSIEPENAAQSSTSENPVVLVHHSQQTNISGTLETNESTSLLSVITTHANEDFVDRVSNTVATESVVNPLLLHDEHIEIKYSRETLEPVDLKTIESTVTLNAVEKSASARDSLGNPYHHETTENRFTNFQKNHPKTTKSA